MNIAKIHFIFYSSLLLHSSTYAICYIVGCYNDNFEMYVSVDSNEGATVRLYCDLCGTSQEEKVVNWFYRKRGIFSPKLYPYQMANRNKRIKLLESGMLTIDRFNSNDSGVYICNQQDKDNISFTYVLDDILKVDLKPKVGPLNEYWKLQGKQISSLNRKFVVSQDEAFLSLRKRSITFTLNITWGFWGPCNKGVRKILGRHRLYPLPANEFQKLPIEDDIVKYYLEDNFDISCRSIKLNETFPLTSRIVRNIPDYEATQSCSLDGSEIDVNNNAIAFVTGDSHDDHTSSISIQIAENGHCTLICAEDTFGSKIVWYKNNEVLNSSYRHNLDNKEGEPRLFIDTYNFLYILHATKQEEASYMCTVNGIKSRKYFVAVVSMAKILNQDFIRYSIYLGFVLSLTVTCYCAGLCVAWHRRTSFADPLNLDYRYIKKKNSCGVNEESTTLLK